jgi:nucleoside-diphosphate-sugar epimerase
MNPLSNDLIGITMRLRPLFEELRGAKIFITGGTGWIGCWLLETVAWLNDACGLGIQVVVLTRDFTALDAKAPHLYRRNDIRCQLGDVRHFSFEGWKFTHIIHGACSTAAGQHPRDVLDVCYNGTKHVLEFAKQCGARRLLNLSSGAVYGEQPVNMPRIPESYSGAPNPCQNSQLAAYGEGKRLAEMLCVTQDKVETVSARIFALVGPYMPLDAHFAMGNFIADGLAQRPIQIRGNGTPIRSYLYAADLVVWLFWLLLRGSAGTAYNVGSEDEISIERLAEAVALHFGVLVASLDRKPNADPQQRYVPDTRKSQIHLGLEAWTPLHESIGRTANWFRAQSK